MLERLSTSRSKRKRNRGNISPAMIQHGYKQRHLLPPDGFLEPTKKLDPKLYNREFTIQQGRFEQEAREAGAYKAHCKARKAQWLKNRHRDWLRKRAENRAKQAREST